LMTVRFPKTLKTLQRRAFSLCSSLKTVDIPASVTSFGDLVFSYCTSLIHANVQSAPEKLPAWTFYGCELLSAVFLAENISQIGKGAFENCPTLFKFYYGGSQEMGTQLLTVIAEQRERAAAEFTMRSNEKPFFEGQSYSSASENNVLVTDTSTVIQTDHSTISTTVTTKTDYTIKEEEGIVMGNSNVNVKIDAVIENEGGWDDLLTAIKNGERQNVDLNEIQVDVTLKDSTEVTGDTLNQFVGKDKVNLNIDMQDGSSVKIDCGRLEYTQEEQAKPVALAYRLSQNTNPTKQHTKVIGNAQSYLLSFDGSLEIDFSPKIYLGKTHSYKTATLYQYIPGRGLSLLQSVIVDKSGYATYYLGSTKDTTQYLIALDVKGVDSSAAIIPEDIAKDQGKVVYYESIDYVVTGVRMFMGLSFFQFSVAVFCVMFVLFVGVGIIMSVIYRKKKMEAYYKMLKNEEDDGFI